MFESCCFKNNKFHSFFSSDVCLSENYTFPFPQDLPLFDYISHHTPLTGRQWLFEKLHSTLFNQSSTLKGVHLVGPMGYGKSAICTHLLCASGNSSAGILRQHIVAYHICRFDVPSTKFPDVFIRRLIGFLANKSKAFHSAIGRAGSSSICYDVQRCREDPIACFDQGIISPLNTINVTLDKPWIILIDALDECSTGDGLANVVLDILRRRAAHLPKWIKFLITSRGVQGIEEFSKLEVVYLSNNDTRNEADMKEFIQTNVVTNWVSGILGESVTQQLITSVGKKDTSFLYISQSVLYYRNNNKISRIPPTLVEIYQSNFERLFGFDRNNFMSARKILEIICASTRPLSKQLLFNIVTFDSKTEDLNSTLYERTVAHLSEFVLNTDNGLVLNHMATFDWLVSRENNKDFYISLVNGHSKIACYMLLDNGANFNGISNNFDLIDLVIHTAKSNDTIKEQFKRFAHQLLRSQNISISFLNSIIASTDEMGNEIALMLNLYDHVDILNDGNVTPAFYAAFKGHVKTLSVLAEAGANLDFAVGGATLIHAFDHFEKLKLIKSQYFWGYNLLHIAVQQSHENIVKYLLAARRKLVNESNTIGMLPIDIACENGFVSLVKILIEANSNISSCFYYASYGGHVDILKLLISLKFSYTCVSNEHAAAEFDSFFISDMQETDKIDHEQVCGSPVPYIKYIRPKDANRTIVKFTALNIAIQFDHTEVVSLLLKEFPHTLDCIDGWGRTPLLQSITERKLGSYKKILQIRKANDICHEVALHVLSENFKYYPYQFDANTCPRHAQLSHLLAKYGTKEMIDYTMTQNIHIYCVSPDVPNLIPFHLAIESSNIYFTDMCSKRLNYVQVRNIKTEAEATVFHHAARYGQFDILRNISKLTYHLVPELIDIYGRSILQYAVLEPNDGSRFESEISKKIVSWLHEKHYHDLSHHDASGRNVIHYAIATGHSNVVSYVISVLKEDFWLLIAKTDMNGYNTIDFGLHFLESKRLTKCYVCMRQDLWSRITRKMKNNIGKVSDIMTNQEMSVFLVIRYAFQNGFNINFFRNHFQQILSKSDVLTIALLEYQQESPFDFTDQIILSIRKGMHPISFLTLARYKPEWLHQCNKHLNASPLHVFMQNGDKNIFYSLNLINHPAPKNYEIFLNWNFHEHGIQIFRRIFGYAGQFDNQFLSCATLEGLNLLHVSLRHGNLFTAHYLLLSGISILNNYFTAQSFFFMAMFSKLKFEIPDKLYEVTVNTDTKKLTQIEYLDYIINLCYKKEQRHLKLVDVCNEERHGLSLTHFAAVNGLTRFLRVVNKRFGNKVLACRNKDLITPLYLAKIFGQIKTVKFLEGEVPLKVPKRNVESQLLFHILHKIDVRNVSEPWHCLLKQDIIWWSMTTLSRYYSCILRAIKKISDLSLKIRITFDPKDPDCKDCPWKLVKGEPEIKRDVLFSTFNFLTYSKRASGTKEKADSLTENLIEGIKALIDIKQKTKANKFMLMRLALAKKWLTLHKKKLFSPTEYDDRLEYLLQYIAFKILLETREVLIVDYALYTWNGLLGFDSITSLQPDSFLNTRIEIVQPFLKNNVDTFSNNLSKYYYLHVLRKSVGFHSIQKQLSSVSIARAFNTIKIAKPYDGSKDPLRDMSDEPRLADYVSKETYQKP